MIRRFRSIIRWSQSFSTLNFPTAIFEILARTTHVAKIIATEKNLSIHLTDKANFYSRISESSHNKIVKSTTTSDGRFVLRFHGNGNDVNLSDEWYLRVCWFIRRLFIGCFSLSPTWTDVGSNDMFSHFFRMIVCYLIQLEMKLIRNCCIGVWFWLLLVWNSTSNFVLYTNSFFIWTRFCYRWFSSNCWFSDCYNSY